MIKILIVISLGLCQQVFADDLLDLLDSTADGTAPQAVQATSGLSSSIRSVLTDTTAEQNIFLSFLDRGEFDKALYQWWPAFSKTEFLTSDNGIAIYSYLLFRNGLAINGMEAFFMAKQPQTILKDLKDLWVKAAPASHDVWSSAKLQWNENWSTFWTPAIEMMVLSRSEQTQSVEYLAQLLRRAPEGGNSRARLYWQIALALEEKGETKKAAQFLVHLIKLKQDTISPELLNLTIARMLYSSGYLDPALSYYNKIPKSSEYWFVAQEESAWTFLRKGHPQNTLAVTQSLLIPEFQLFVGPESVFLRSLSELKVCDYVKVANSISYFKWRFKGRAHNLQNLVKGENQAAVNDLFARLQNGRVRLVDLGSNADLLPRYVARDIRLYNSIQAAKKLAAESKQAADLYAQSLAGASSQVGFQAWIEDLKVSANKRAQSQIAASKNLLNKRAKHELDEINNILQKMHIVEAEAIQQTSMVERIAKVKVRKIDLKTGSTGSKDSDALKFPFDGERWFDEVSNYKIDIKKACQAMRGAQ